MRRKWRASPSGSAGVQGSRLDMAPVCTRSNGTGRSSKNRRHEVIDSPGSTEEPGRMQTPTSAEILVLGGTGKTGRRVVRRLRDRQLPVRVGSRSGTPPFDWEDRSTWAPALRGAGSVYLSYHPDLAAPRAVETVGALAELAVASAVPRLVLLSGRGEPEAEEAEQAVRASGAELTIVRSAWFAQNFSEDFLLDGVLGGVVALPAGDTPEPFVDADDIADVAVAALTEAGHVGELYELTGPRALTFAESVAEIGRAAGREVRYVPVSLDEFAAAAVEQ